MLADWISDGQTMVTQDASPRLSREAEYSGEVFSSPLWTIIAAWADDKLISASTLIEIAVIPADAVTKAVKREIDDDRFSDAVTCEDGRDQR